MTYDVTDHYPKLIKAAQIFCRKRRILDRDEIDDYAGDGMYAAIRAAKSYDRSKGMAFSVWCIKKARYAFKDRYRKSMKLPEFVRLDEDLVDDEGEEGTLYEKVGDTAPDPMDLLVLHQEYMELMENFGGLSDDEQFVMEALYGTEVGDQLSQEDVAFLMNAPQAKVSRVHATALAKLKARRSNT